MNDFAAFYRDIAELERNANRQNRRQRPRITLPEATTSAAGRLIASGVGADAAIPRYEDLQPMQDAQTQQNRVRLAERDAAINQAARDARDRSLPAGVGFIAGPLADAVTDPARRADIGQTVRRLGQWVVSDQPIVPREWIDAITPENVRGAVQAAPAAVARAPEAVSSAAQATGNAIGSGVDWVSRQADGERPDFLGGVAALSDQYGPDIFRSVTYGPYADQREAQRQIDVARELGDEGSVRRLAGPANEAAAWNLVNGVSLPFDAAAVASRLSRVPRLGAAVADEANAARVYRPAPQTEVRVEPDGRVVATYQGGYESGASNPGALGSGGEAVRTWRGNARLGGRGETESAPAIREEDPPSALGERPPLLSHPAGTGEDLQPGGIYGRPFDYDFNAALARLQSGEDLHDVAMSISVNPRSLQQSVERRIASGDVAPFEINAPSPAMRGPKPRFTLEQAVELVRDQRLNWAQAGRRLNTDPSNLRQRVMAAISAGRIKAFPLPPAGAPRLLRAEYDEADFINSALQRDQVGRLPSLEAITVDLRGDNAPAGAVRGINTQYYRLSAMARAAVKDGNEAVGRLAQDWRVTPERLREFAAIAGERRGISIQAEARRLHTSGVTEPQAIIAALRDYARRAGIDVREDSLAVAATNARTRARNLSRGTETEGGISVNSEQGATRKGTSGNGDNGAAAIAIGAGAGAGLSASNARADTGDGRAENNWPTIVGGGVGGAILGGLLARGHLGRTGARLGDAASEGRAAINQETYDAIRSSIARMDGPETEDLARTFGVDPNAVDRAHQIATRIASEPEAVSAFAGAPRPERVSQSQYIASVRQSVAELANTEEFEAVARRWGVDPDALDAPEQLTRFYLRSMPTPEAADYLEQASSAASAQFERLPPQQRLQVADQLGLDASAPDFAQQAGDHFTRPIHEADRGRLNAIAGPLAAGGLGAATLLNGGEARAQDQESQIRPLPEGMDFREGNWLEPQWRQITLPDGSPGVERAILGPDRQPHIIVARQGADASISVLGETSPSAGPPPPSAPRVGNHMEVRANGDNAPTPRGPAYTAPGTTADSNLARRLGAVGVGLLSRGVGERVLRLGPAAREVVGMGGTFVGGRALGLDNTDAATTSLATPALGIGADFAARRVARLGGDIYTGLHNGATAQMTDRALLSDPEFLSRRRAFMQTLPEEMPRARVSAGSDLEMGAFADQPANVEMDRRGNIVAGLSPYSEFAASSPTEQAVWMDRLGFEAPQDAERVAAGRTLQRRLGAMRPALPAATGDSRGMPPMNRRTRGERTGPTVQRRAATRPAGQTMNGFIDAAARAGFTIPRGRSNAETARNIADAVRGNPRLEQLARDWGLSVLLAAGIGAGAASETRAEVPN